MNDPRKALGRGLDSLLPSRSAPAQPAGPQEVAVDLIDPNPYQTRSRLDEAALEELTNSVRASGVVQPVLLRPIAGGRFQLIAGERRWLASRRAGKATIPAVVKEVSSQQAMEITIIENLQREDLSPMEQARAFDRLGREFGLTQEEIAGRTGKDRPSITNYVRLLKLPEIAKKALEKGTLSFGHGKVLCSLLDHPQLLERVAHDVVSKSLSVRQTELLVAELVQPREKRKRPSRAADPNVRAAQESLERILGMKVNIIDHGGQGMIVIQYGSLDDFDRVVDALSRK